MTSLETQPPRLEETDAVHELLNRLYAAWADNDAEAVADRYRDDATVVPAGIGRTSSSRTRGCSRRSASRPGYVTRRRPRVVARPTTPPPGRPTIGGVGA